ncbi:hypothetical protein ACQCX2_09615 [Propionibacteriaceae bacterium Y1700]|uniref:hypothetical protein n=1 Tax=Microlunatus sp. Y1700 TaxID=3418487 RepID=UPI003DA775FC
MDPELSGIAAGIGVLVSAAATAGSPSGAGVLVAVAGGAVGMVGVADPTEFLLSAEAWGVVQERLADHARELNFTYQGYKDYWTGDAAEAFQTYWERTLAPLLEPTAELAGQLGAAATELAQASTSFLTAFAIATVGCLLAELAALPAMTPPATAAGIGAQWGAASIFFGYLSALTASLLILLTRLTNLSADLGDSMEELGDALADARRLSGPTLQAPQVLAPTARLSDWHEGEGGVRRNPDKDAG